ncbi:MAG: hypothetical protein A2268_04060 [Candidatus Raymondbacteria bacterium RifOxyA12_full_50_37]|uniref:Uncharacterized protein n=1 Tax=Candidatus Raymondbacteria bacterium RIFOXYD12_FULL_49_13 TaxID=1817890 RepID=A0A1F7FB76_UNCRA|nr:MAG: hypothetical protein A2268_04060 [Candidatus Raymondbacteria bacterium RifOxyA12_full_50_37]OGJ92600.1 MAG: hypothetical protein A2248_05890 [Candidatus Raymondbacteria bacterium RIFOXYA2_FULL_49_16]OGJ92703.1 MAG: hypothetical protein A2350_16680 [Candidatus Raymondbacteria bacterium RifOxyB12_full_50_8]OGJ97954.1 MAG: hypothetical protein A2453_02915 [Candidatus Raymondbacteria bacterium RIFOXYC2_FULL_50_21]OGK02052.1 MAG: hypothetical protein A2487_01320 [Candidatus Raymondbacteria b
MLSLYLHKDTNKKFIAKENQFFCAICQQVQKVIFPYESMKKPRLKESPAIHGGENGTHLKMKPNL